jgi:glucose-6-phosphate isomerase
MLNLDLSKLSGFLPDDFVAARQAKLENAASMLATHTGPGGDFTGWVYLPRDYDKDEFARIKAAAKKIQQQSQVLVVIGIAT